LQDNDSDFLYPFASELYGSYQKASVGVHFIFVVSVQGKKIKKKQKEGRKFLKKRKIENEKKKVEKKKKV
jgi:hypothetical protein